ncbi:DUF3581 family protein [Salinibius halmophilus]|uniref:DUF3581 family protein n=1 Tax=Salinibius halmophilus TaxID=1853216 RepID=UPI000E66B368|nr:DUF3581 family protein [Salinibius halmophilus]
MHISNFYSVSPAGLQISREQGSQFAKSVAGDFNPLHDADAKRFVVPGDLLFAILLTEFGANESMKFQFSGMVNDEMQLTLQRDTDQMSVLHGEKVMTSAAIAGPSIQSAEFIKQLILAYVSFSGTTYPHILVPVMRQAGVMINPARPMVMYQSMEIELNGSASGEISLRPSQHQFDVNGKRGDMYLNFDILSGDEVIGRGSKHMLLSGLRAYDESAITALTEEYDASKASFA